MISFEHPLALWLAVPWLAGWWGFARAQRRSLAWLEANVSPRFRGAFTVHGPRSLRLHLLFLLALGLLLVAAAAGPVLPGEVEAEAEGGRVLLLLDASVSMYTDDAAPAGGAAEPLTRFEAARRLATELARILEAHRFALVTYSGTATVHLPTTADRDTLAQALRAVEPHNYYQNTGSSLAAALDAALAFAGEGGKQGREEGGVEDLQVVLLGDGELPFPQAFDAPLEALASRGVPVHAVTVGSAEGQGRVIYDFRDVVAGKAPEERRVLREFTTRRVDEHFRRAARRTGGHFEVAGADTAATLAAEIARRPARRRVAGGAAGTRGQDLSAWPLLLFLAGLLFDALILGHRARRPDFAFDVHRLGERGAATRAVALLALAPLLGAQGCTGPAARAYWENERGIASDRLGRHDAAGVHYRRGLAYGVMPEIPTFNLARSATLAGRHAEAHDLYQQALVLEPELAEAHYNDGITLWRWGVAERDPRNCELARALDLWRQAARRFASTRELVEPASPLAAGARRNAAFLARRIAALEDLIAHPPEHCATPPEPQGGGGGGGGDGDGDGGESDAGGGGGGNGDGDRQAEDGGSGGGSGDAPPPSTSPQPLTGPELQQIQQELQRARAQAREEGKYHRRTRPEQFPEESWKNPEAEIWW